MSVVLLGGKPVLNDASWSLRPGTAPVQADFEMTPQDADSLLQGALEPITLEMGNGAKKTVTIRFLYVLEKRPGETPHTSVVRVVDRRWFWSREHVSRTYNIRRKAGHKRVKAGFNRPEIDPIADKIKYASFSLDNGKAWTAKRALEDVWEKVKKGEQTSSGASAKLRISSDLSRLSARDLPMEDIRINESGPAAFARLLSFIPGAELTVTAEGDIYVYSAASGDSDTVMQRLGDEEEGGGHAELLTNERIRPSEVHVLFEPEVEMRFDFNEPSGRRSTVARGANDPYVENVAPVPDYSLNLASTGKPVAQGTWATITDLLNSWGDIPRFGRLDYKAIRRALVPYMDLWTGPRLAGLRDGDADWGSRIAALQQHFRRTYRINPDAMERFLAIHAHRVATIDPQQGSRAPAVAYTNWSVVATQRYLAVQTSGKNDFAYATKFESFPANGELDANARPAPADVRIADPDQGIISLDFRMDENRVHEQIIPGFIDNIPTGTIIPGKAIAFNEVARNRYPELSTGHKMATVLTVSPGSPNSNDRLFRLVRRPSDVKGVLPPSLRGGLNSANGPRLEVSVGAGWEVARFAWVDKEGNRIKKAVGVSNATGGTVNDIADLCVNLGAQKGLGTSAASLDAIATAVAAGVYAGFADRVEGSKTVPVKQAEVEGFIDEILHSVNRSGEVKTTAKVSEKREAVDMMTFLPTSVRNLLFKIKADR